MVIDGGCFIALTLYFNILLCLVTLLEMLLKNDDKYKNFNPIYMFINKYSSKYSTLHFHMSILCPYISILSSKYYVHISCVRISHQ
jgi:hypothetical protein